MPNDWKPYPWGPQVLTRCAELAERDTKLSQEDRRSLTHAYQASGQAKATQAKALLTRMIENRAGNPLAQNQLAWVLSIRPNPEFASQAVTLAEEATAKAPQDGNCWNTLGAARYRAGDRKGAVEALHKSMELRNGGDSWGWFFQAMVFWQLNDKEQARKWYDQAARWMEQTNEQGEEMLRIRKEAADVLGIEGQPTTNDPGSLSGRRPRSFRTSDFLTIPNDGR